MEQLIAEVNSIDGDFIPSAMFRSRFMNFTRVALGSVVILASASSVSWVARQPVFAKANIAELPIRKEFFTVIPEFKSFMLQETPKKVFPKVDPKDEIPLPEGPGKNTTKRVCGNCHSTNVWIKQRHTTEKWSSIIDNMVTKGMEASDDDLATVNEYLGKYLAPPPKEPPPADPPK
jgi:hypothetical protein